MRQAKYAGATKSKTSWLEKQLKIREQFEREYIDNLSDADFAKHIRSQLKQIFGKK